MCGALVGMPAAGHEIITNHFGLAIPTNAPHIYADGTGHLFVYGGSPAEQAPLIQQYFVANPNTIVYGVNNYGYRIPWNYFDGRLVSGPPLRVPGFFGFLFGRFMGPPGPDEFYRLIR